MAILDGIFNPLLKFAPIWVVMGFSFVFSLITMLIYKFATDQNAMKKLKEEMKSYQEQIKAERNNPARAMEIQKKSMAASMQMMNHSLKASLYTIIPAFILLAWMNAHLAYEPLYPEQEFFVNVSFVNGVSGNVDIVVPDELSVKDNKSKEINGKSVSWRLEGKEGLHQIEFKIGEENVSKEVLITGERNYAEVVTKVKKSMFKEIVLGNEKLNIMNLFGWKLGWLGTYILSSLLFTSLLRKVLKVY